MESVILLNQDFSFLTVLNWKKAIKLLVKEKVEVIKYSKKEIRNAESTVKMVVPKVIKLLYYIKNVNIKVKYSKRNVLVRDQFTCAYCGGKPRRLTVDHIIPKSKGGKSTYENTVNSAV